MSKAKPRCAATAVDGYPPKVHAVTMLIYKIFRAAEYAEFTKVGATNGAPIDISDGYVHFSTAEQFGETLSKHFSGETGLWNLALEAEQLADDLRWEPSRGGQLFPHLYRELRETDILWAKPIVTGPNGPILPELA